ncbi:hypothetical protein ACLKA7_008195 [Drosophila subpalustris]
MFSNRKALDEHVHKMLNKLPPGPERDRKGLCIGRNYFKIKEYAKAIEYLNAYLKIADEAGCHSLIAKCYQLQKTPDKRKALEHYQRSIQLQPNQQDVIKEGCQLLFENNSLCTPERVAYWLELAAPIEDLKDTELMLALKLRANGKLEGNEEENSIEMFIHKELLARPNDFILHVRLLRHYLETKRFEDAFNYANKIELEKPAQCQSGDWYELIWKVLLKREQSKELAKDWSFWQLLLITLDRLIQLSLQSESNSSLSDSIGQLFKLDQYIYKFSLLIAQLSATDNRELHQCCLDHYIGQLLLHAASLLFKRELIGKKNKWSITVRSALPLLLLGYQKNDLKNEEFFWERRCNAEQHKLLQLWRRQAAFRCAQLGRTLYGCLQTSVDVENKDMWKDNKQPGLWPSTDKLLSEARQYCADNEWRSKLYQQLYTHSEHKLKEQTSYLMRDHRLQQPLYECPTVAEIEEYEQVALLLEPHTLEHHVYLALGANNLAEAPRVRFLKNLRHECLLGLTYCGVDSLCQVDVEVFLYFVALQAQRKLQVQQESHNSYHAGNLKATARPLMLPYANIMKCNDLLTKDQCNWWSLVQRLQVNSQLNDGNHIDQRDNLKRGLEALRGVNGPHAEIIALFHVAKLLTSRPDKATIEARIEALYKLGINMLRRHHHQQLEPFSRYFKYENIQASDIWLQTQRMAEDAVRYLSTRYFKNGHYEDFLSEIRGLQLPVAVYLQAEAYRQMAESSRVSRLSRQNLQERRMECLKQAKNLIANQPDHLLHAVIQRELVTSLTDETFGSPNSLDMHNNSSTYEDAEDDFYAQTAASLNRSRRQVEMQGAATLELDQSVKQLSKHICALKDNVDGGMEGMRQEIKTLTDKVNSVDSLHQEMKTLTEKVEELLKKVKISGGISRETPTRDVDAAAAAAALGLDEFFNMEDTQQSNFLNPALNAPDRFFPPGANVPPHPNAAYGSPMFNQNQMYNYYANQAQFLRTPPAQPNFYGQRGAANYSMPGGNMYPTAGGAPFIEGINYGVPPPSLVMPQVSQAQPTALPLNQPLNQPVQSNLPVTPAGGFFNTPPFVPPPAQLPQQLPPVPQVPQQLPLVQHKPISAPAQTTAPGPTIVSVAASVVTAAPPIPAAAPAAAAAPAIFNRALNNQPVEKEPPANVVITSSDPLPKPAASTAQLTLSVTIPAQHIKPSLVPAIEPPTIPSNDFKFNLGNNNKDSGDTNNIFQGLGSTGGFSFKTQVAQAAAEKQKELAAEAAANNESVHSEGNQDVSAELDYDPRPDFQGIIPLPDEVEVRTGEEDEVIKFTHRAKLFRHVDKEWKERGIGDIKILKNQSTGCTRILMRREQTHKICANHKITAGMTLTTPEQDKDAKSLLWAANDFADEKLQLEKFLVRFKLPETAKQFKLAFEEAAKSAKSDVPTMSFGNVKTSTNNSFVTSTPAATAVPKPIEPVAKTDTIGAAIESVVSKSLFGSQSSNASSLPTNKTSTASSSPFSNFSFGSIGNANKPPNASNLSFGSFSAAPDNSNTGYTTAFNFGSNLTSKADSTLQDQQPQQSIASKADTQAEADAEEEFEPTAQFQPVIPLPELVDVVTGEENEIVLFEHRAKLSRYDKAANEWKQRGLGNIKLLQQKSDPTQVRLLMRREQIFKLCCNQRLRADTKFIYPKNSDNSLSWAGYDYSEEELKFEMLCVRFKTAETCKEFHDAVLKAQSNMAQEKPEEKPQEQKPQQDDKVDKDVKPITQGFGDAFKPKLGSWSCKGCYTNNDAGQLYCLACEAPKDDTVAPKAPTLDLTGALNLSNSAGKFNFGFPASTTGFTFGAKPSTEKKEDTPVAKTTSSTTPTPTPVVSITSNRVFPADIAPSTVDPPPSVLKTEGFGDAFKPRAGSWSCKDCYTSNEGAQLYCVACQAPKDDTVPKKDNKLNASFPATNSKFTFGFGAPTAAAVPAATASDTFVFKINDQREKIDGGLFGSTSFNFKPTTAETTLGSLGSNTFSFSMPKATTSMHQQQQPNSPTVEANNDDEGHVEEEENNAYFAPVIPLPDKIDVKTGEEDEDLLYIQRAKLYRLADGGEWKERGLGNVKILRHKQTKNLRVVMRREQVLKICLNHVLNSSVAYKPKDEKSWLFVVHDFSEGESVLERLALRFKSADIAQSFLNAVNSAVNGTAEPITFDENPPMLPSSSTPSKATAEHVVSNDIKKLADKLQLSCEFLTRESKCSGCRGCDPDIFDFGPPAKVEPQIEPLPLTLPALKMPAPKQEELSNKVAVTPTSNRTLLKASTLEANSAANNFGSFGGFSSAVSANSTVTTVSADKTKEQSVPLKSGFVFGNPEKSVFGQSIFGGNSVAKPQGSIFGGSPATDKVDNQSVSIFGGSFKPQTDKQDEGGKSIFGSSTLPGNGFSSSGFTFGSLAANSTTPVQDNKENIGSTPSPLFAATTENKSGNSFSDLAAKVGDDFASLAAKAGGNPIGFQKSETGGFFGLTHQDDFKNFKSPSNTKMSESAATKADDSEVGVTDENYDPHYEPIIELPNEIVVSTGEEEETKLFGERATLYRYVNETKEWKERGVGELKVLKHNTLNSSRLVMRREQIHKLVLNMGIGAGFSMDYMNEQKKSFIWASVNYAESSTGELEKLACRFKKQEIAENFFETIKTCIKEAKESEEVPQPKELFVESEVDTKAH